MFSLRALSLFACGVFLAGCVSLVSPSGLETGVAPRGEPPRADGPIPPAFTAFVNTLWPEASRAGVSRKVFDAAFSGIGPDEDVLARANRQAEFVKPIWEYLDGAVSDTRLADGAKMRATHQALLNTLEARYGVPGTVILAIWGMESSYGKILGDPKVVKNAVRALATLAYAGGSRARYGRSQLIALLKILERGDIDARHITGSWAGAMGHTQFIPTTYLAYAVDHDGDGRRNIWTSIPDALASTASYLNRAGWRRGESWGYEVSIPASLDAKEQGKTRTLAEWEARGIKRVTGEAFPRPQDRARLFAPAGFGAPVFLLLPNFNVIKRYNNADAYALSVGHLGDRLAGAPAFRGRWPRLYEPVNDAGKLEIQQRLAALGYDIGEIDGKIGAQTLAAIRAYQAAQGLSVDGYPSLDLLQHLRAQR